MAVICFDRLLKQRSALRKPDIFFGFPPPCGGLRSLSVGAYCCAPIPRAFLNFYPKPDKLLRQELARFCRIGL
jgi:hypothetical protein